MIVMFQAPYLVSLIVRRPIGYMISQNMIALIHRAHSPLDLHIGVPKKGHAKYEINSISIVHTQIVS